MFIMPIGSYLVQNNWNPRLLIFMGAAVAFPCFIASSFMDSFAGFAVFYVAAFSINQGITYMVPVHHGWLWYPNKPGLISGIILGGFGVGGLVFDNVFTHLINPDNKSADEDTGFYDKDIDNRFVETWRFVIYCWLGLAILGFVMTFPGPLPKKRISGSVSLDQDKLAYPQEGQAMAASYKLDTSDSSLVADGKVMGESKDDP